MDNDLAGLAVVGAPPQQSHVVYDFVVPESLCIPGLARKVTLRLLSSGDEITASELGRFNVHRQQVEAAKLSIAFLDGKRVDPSTGEIDAFWEKSGPKLRSLLLQAFNRVSSPSVEEEKSFFDSQVNRVV